MVVWRPEFGSVAVGLFEVIAEELLIFRAGLLSVSSQWPNRSCKSARSFLSIAPYAVSRISTWRKRNRPDSSLGESWPGSMKAL